MPCCSLLSRDWTSLCLPLRARAQEVAPLARGCEAKGRRCPGALSFPAAVHHPGDQPRGLATARPTYADERVLPQSVLQGLLKGSNLIPKLGQRVRGSTAPGQFLVL